MDQPDNRRRFLARLSERLGKSRRESAPPPEGETREEKLTEEERISRFLHNLSLLGGRGVRIRGREELKRRLMEDVEGDKASPLIFWKDAFLEEITDDLSNVERIPWESGRDAAELIRDAERAKAGLVRADWGVASTGSIALIGGQGRDGVSACFPPFCSWCWTGRTSSPIPAMSGAGSGKPGGKAFPPTSTGSPVRAGAPILKGICRSGFTDRTACLFICWSEGTPKRSPSGPGLSAKLTVLFFGKGNLPSSHFPARYGSIPAPGERTVGCPLQSGRTGDGRFPHSFRMER